MNRLFTTLCVLGAVLFGQAAHALLSEEQAFKLETRMEDGVLVLDWRTAAQYYQFRDKFRLAADSPAVVLGAPELPGGDTLQDDFFGNVQVLRGDWQMRVPVTAEADAPARFNLLVTSQGCNDGGDCYPSYTRSVSVETPAPAVSPAVAPDQPAADPLAALAQLGGGNGLDANGEDEFLDPDVAYVMSTEAVDGQLVASWKIADGYYLYRDKFKFKVLDPAGVLSGAPQIPAGEIKEDEFFGKVAVFHNQVRTALPLPGVSGPATVAVTYQGCAEAGLCYPPITKKVAFDLPAANPPAQSAGGNPLAALSELAGSLGADVGGEDEFLDPEVAYVMSTETRDGKLMASWKIADGYYLYRDKFKFKVLEPAGAPTASPVIPKGEIKEDEFFGKVEVFHQQAQATLPLPGISGAGKVEVTYQGCAEAGLCYPPIKKTVAVNLTGGGGGGVQPAIAASAAPAVQTPPPADIVSEQDEIAGWLANKSIWLNILIFFGFGIALTFTPCVFPMIPILSGIIVGQGVISGRKAFALSAVYVLAMGLTYTAAGVAAGLTGANLQVLFQEPWILITFAVVFVLLALSMFGFYELQMPASIQTRLANASNRQGGGTVIGVAIMGFLSALIVGPCMAAPLAGALIYIGQTGDPLLGGTALFSMSMGMGVPLMIVGTVGAKILPRAGAWMDKVKAVFGVMLLGVAIWMVERIVPGWIAMLLWAGLLIVSAIYMGALDSLTEAASGWRRLWKGAGLIVLVYGVMIMVGAMSGGDDVLQPLKGIAVARSAGAPGSTDSAEGEGLQFQRVKGLAGVNAALASASRAGKPVMLDYYADWCVSCKELEKYTFSDPESIRLLSKGVVLQTDVTPWDDQDQELVKNFGLQGPPTIQFFGVDGQEMRGYRLVGFIEAEEFRDHVRKAFGPL